jgi:hypothetical protein
MQTSTFARNEINQIKYKDFFLLGLLSFDEKEVLKPIQRDPNSLILKRTNISTTLGLSTKIKFKI